LAASPRPSADAPTFLQQAGFKLNDFKGEVGFSGDHDKTIKLVEAGTYGRCQMKSLALSVQKR